MQAIKFPVPNRSEYIPSPYEPDADGVLDIGYYKGSIIGGQALRPGMLADGRAGSSDSLFFRRGAGCL